MASVSKLQDVLQNNCYHFIYIHIPFFLFKYNLTLQCTSLICSNRLQETKLRRTYPSIARGGVNKLEKEITRKQFFKRVTNLRRFFNSNGAKRKSLKGLAFQFQETFALLNNLR